jgi:RHS repeat-associated protein
MRINSTLYYVLKDHLGSASVVTTANGQVVTNGEQRYFPFGEARLSPSSMLTDKLFTGQREMAGLGIYHYGARFYSPKLGRFLSADSIVPGMFNPQNLNRFSYGLNNPSRYTDPTGHWVDEGCGSHICNDTKGAGIRVISGTRVGNSNRNSDGDLVYSAPPPQPPSSGGDDGGGSDLLTGLEEFNQDCSWSGAFGGEGCDPHYYSLGLGLDAPTLMMLSGAVISFFAPEVGLPVALSGAAFEACAWTATPLCAAVKLASANLALTLDKDGNFYMGPQYLGENLYYHLVRSVSTQESIPPAMVTFQQRLRWKIPYKAFLLVQVQSVLAE